MLGNFLFKPHPNGQANEYSGFFSTWQDALKQTKGYNDQHIFEKVKKAALAVKSGKALFERDSVLFYKPVYNWPLLAILLRISYQYSGKLNLIDFGGSLGSTYFQHKDFLSSLSEIKWNIIEQEHFVKFGKKHIASKELRFFYNLTECFKSERPNVFLASSVIGYIENPFKLISAIMKQKIEHIIIDRTTFIDSANHEILIQKVSPIIYNSSYPMWAFNYKKFISLLRKEYKLEIDYESYLDTDYYVEGKRLYWRGLYFTKR